MRWRFAEFGLSPEEAAARARTLEAIDSWWREFARKQGDILALFSRKQEWDLGAWMRETLGVIDEKLMWEFGLGLTKGHRLVITPEVERHLRPLVAEILRRAPSLPDWEFYAYRPPESWDMTMQTVEARTGGNVSNAWFTARCGPGNSVDLSFGGAGVTEKSQGDFFVATETLLGEEILDKWTGAVEVAPPDAEHGRPLAEMKETVDRMIEGIKAGLPSAAWMDIANEAKWTVMKLEPKERADYPFQDDIFVAKTTDLEMWRAAFGNGVFSSSRFSRQGETFCYVKLDGSEGLDVEKFADKSEIEDALDTALGSKRLGCHVGGGTGLRYSYINLAVTDVDRACKVIRDVLRAGDIHRRSWIFFFDSEWAREWVGIYDDSPPPPMEHTMPRANAMPGTRPGWLSRIGRFFH